MSMSIKIHKKETLVLHKTLNKTLENMFTT
jgi:hypothetical protein